MSWSAKAKGLLQDQYAPVGNAGRLALNETVKELGAAKARGCDLGNLAEHYKTRALTLDRLIRDFRGYGVAPLFNGRYFVCRWEAFIIH